MLKKAKLKVYSLVMTFLMIFTNFIGTGGVIARAEGTYNGPKLLITEVCYKSADEAPFIELYNASNEDINLKDYDVYRITTKGVAKIIADNDKVIKANHVLTVSKFADLSTFNKKYNTNILEEDFINLQKNNSQDAWKGSGFIAIVLKGAVITQSTYKTDAYCYADYSAMDVDKSNSFKAPVSGNGMLPYTGDTPNPGTITDAQKPVTTPVPEVKVTGVTLSPKTAEVEVNKKTLVTAEVSPKDATNKKVSWSSSNDKVAAVDSNGNVTGIAEGTATITVTTEDGNLQDTMVVTVKKATEVSVVTIADARKATGTVAIEGFVTYSKKSTLVLQDNTAGITASNYGTSLDFSSINKGTKVRITGKIGVFHDLVQITPSTEVEILDTKTDVPAPKNVTIEEALAGAYESQLIKIDNVTLGNTDTKTHMTQITDKSGKVLNIYYLGALTDIKAGDLVSVSGVLSRYGAYQLLGDSAEVTKIAAPDTEAPVINHTAVASGNIYRDLSIEAKVTDNNKVQSVKLYYRIKGTLDYKNVEMAKGSADSYSFVIPKAELSKNGLEYYIEATDGKNISTSPKDIKTPYNISISDKDIDGPEINSITPKEGDSTGDIVKPLITVNYSDISGIDLASIKLTLDGVDVTSKVTIKTTSSILYTPENDLSKGSHTAVISLKDLLGNETIKKWDFTVGEEEYKTYFGQIHSHTAQGSDGIGTYDEAYSHAKDVAHADFFAITDHSNWFDNDKVANIKDGSMSTRWNDMHGAADKYNENGKFVAIAAYEMTWSGSTGGYGHINTFNTPGFETRNNSKMDLKTYYDAIGTQTQSISQLNHPGKTFGDFDDFAYWSPQADKVVNLIEVGNGEGAVRGSGYFPSYDYYTRALDKGWHVAPTNNQDNHKGKWVDANTARTVIVAKDLTRDSIYEAMQQKRVYASEDNDLKVSYKVNGQVMGSSLKDAKLLSFSIKATDPDVQDKISKVSIISDGGAVVAEKTFDSNTISWDTAMDAKNSYYYVKIVEKDQDIAATAPVWCGEVVPYGISKVEASEAIAAVGDNVGITATVYNNDTKDIDGVNVEFFKDKIDDANKLGEVKTEAIKSGAMSLANFNYKAVKAGSCTIYARTTIMTNEGPKVFVGSTKIQVQNAEDLMKVVVDGGHQNQYVTGNYKDKIGALTKMLSDKNVQVVVNKDELTAEDLKDAKLLIITDPQSTDDTKYGVLKSKYSDAEIAVIKDFVDKGGNIIVSSKADYKDGSGEYSNGEQENKILRSIGTSLRVNDDEVCDDVKNGGQSFRLNFNKFTSTKYNLTKDIPDGQLYSFYSGSSVITEKGADTSKVDYLVSGYDTTYTLDSDNAGDNTPVEKGKVCVLAAEELKSGAKVIVAGSTFFSDFEITGDNINANLQITKNVIDWTVQPKAAELKSIKDIRVDADNNNEPDLLGKRFTIEGTVTSQSEAVTPKNAFFEVIYVQDATAGITVFGVSKTPLKLGQKVRITGFVDQYQGDSELQISNEDNDVEIIDSSINEVAPKEMKTYESMQESTEGLLVKVTGKVVKMNEQNLYLDDGSGVSRVYVEGYIGDGSGDTSKNGKWDSNIKVGDTVSAVGLASEDPEGHRLRVRNVKEIALAAAPNNPTNVNNDTDKVVEEIKKAVASNTEVPVIDVTNNSVVSADVFNALKNTNKSITFVGNGISWTFNSITKDVSTNIDLSLKPVSNALRAKELAKVKKMTGNDLNIVPFSFTYDGELPGVATVKIFLSKDLANKTVNIYRYFEDSNTYKIAQSNLKVDSEGYVMFTTDHCSDYFAVEQNAAAKLPKTGSPIDFAVLVDFGMLLSALGCALILKRKNGKEEA